MSQAPWIVYADSEPANRARFVDSFADRFNVHAVGSGAQTEAFLGEHSVAVLMASRRLPEMAENELLTRVKVAYPDVVRLVLTPHGGLDPTVRAINDGLVARYALEPWEQQELAAILDWAMEAYQVGRRDSALQQRVMQTERLVTLGSIGAAVIHDIKQPLSYLSANSERLKQLQPALDALAQLAERHAHELSPAEAQTLQHFREEFEDIAADMVEGCQVMRGLTNSVRRLLYAESNAACPSANALTSIRYALSVCRDLALRAKGSLQYEGPSDLPLVRIDATELSQVLINLVANGAQALSRRELPGGKVVVDAQPGTSELHVEVQDDGPGMGPEVLEKVGTPFFSTREGGTGLGVAQARRLVEKAGGVLSIRSQAGRGTNARFTVPKA